MAKNLLNPNIDIIIDGSNIIIKDVKDFNLKETLECGQCFNFIDKNIDIPDNKKEHELLYSISAYGKGLDIAQDKNTLVLYNTSIDDVKNIWINYFDLSNNYSKIKKDIINTSPELEKVITDNNGIHLLNQEFFETTISFIISQNNHIPRIKKIINSIGQEWGYSLNNGLYAFPNIEALSEVGEEEFQAIKTGFRAKYIVDAIKKISCGYIKEDELRGMTSLECEKELCNIKGVGNKVANCIMLFSLGKRDSFPIDVWMKRILEEIYFNGEEKKKDFLFDFAKEKFGEIGGYAQQYLFAYARGIK